MAFAVLVILATALVALPKAANATMGGCYGSGCNGLNPSGRCDSDAITVASMATSWGQLDLRYSPSCKSNWGRYTPYARSASFFATQGKGIYARVTVWNPGGSSYGVAYEDPGVYGSSWSKMTDGRPTACTGVEVLITGQNGDEDSQGWIWGPCY